jgi:hypothetical protein
MGDSIYKTTSFEFNKKTVKAFQAFPTFRAAAQHNYPDTSEQTIQRLSVESKAGETKRHEPPHRRVRVMRAGLLVLSARIISSGFRHQCKYKCLKEENCRFENRLLQHVANGPPPDLTLLQSQHFAII